MYNVSEAYKTAIVQNTIDDYVVGTITLVDTTIVTVTNDLIKDLSYNNQCVSDDGFNIGISFIGEQEITIYDKTSLGKVYEDAIINLNYYLKVSETTYEAVPLGIFKVITSERIDDDVIKLTAHDNMAKFNVDYPLNSTEKSTMRTPFARLKDVCIACGVSLWDIDLEVEYTIGNMPNGTLSHNLAFSTEIITAKDYIDWICQLLCAFATIDRNGNLKIVCWKLIGLSTAYDIPDNLRKSTLFIQDTIFGYNQINMQVVFVQDAATQIIKSPITPSSDGDVLVMETNPIIRAGLYSNAQSILNEMSAALTNTDPEYSNAIMRWYPCEVEYTGDPALDLGDWVTYVGYTAGDGVKVPIHSIDWKYRGWQKLITTNGIKNNTAVNSQRSTYNGMSEIVGNSIGRSGSGEHAEIFNDYTGNIASGSYSHASGHNCHATGYGSFASGEDCLASGQDSFAFGDGCQATNSDAFALGYACIAAGMYCFALGNGCQIPGSSTECSFAMGQANLIGNNADYNFAVGYQNNLTSSGYYSAAIGYKNIISNSAQAALAMGYQNTASANSSACLGGRDNFSHGEFSIAIGGNLCDAKQAYSICLAGEGLISGGYRQAVAGKYNVEDTTSQYALIIGGGTSATRKNIFTVDWNGNVAANNSNVFDLKANFPVTGKSNVLYIATDEDKIYRWNGTVYVQLT